MTIPAAIELSLKYMGADPNQGVKHLMDYLFLAHLTTEDQLTDDWAEDTDGSPHSDFLRPYLESLASNGWTPNIKGSIMPKLKGKLVLLGAAMSCKQEVKSGQSQVP